MRNSDAYSYGGIGRAEHRRARLAPKARLWPGRQGFYPSLYPWAWYTISPGGPRDAEFVWLQTAHGLTRVRRPDVEVRATDGR